MGRRSPSDKARDVVVEGDHAASTLWSTLEPVEGDEQPVRHAIDARYLDTIAGWIDAGAACLVEPGPRSFAFSTVQSEVLNDLCIGCHFAPPRPEFANLVLDQGAWSTLVEGPDPYVVPGDPEGSLLYMKLMGTQSAEDGERMPPLETLTTEQLTLVYGWILEGAAP